MAKSNYDKFPSIPSKGKLFSGWHAICEELKTHLHCSSNQRFVLAVECYQGTFEDDLIKAFRQLAPALLIHTTGICKNEDSIRAMTQADVTDDRIFGHMTRLSINDFLDATALANAQESICHATGLVIVVGPGASLFTEHSNHLLVYADMARWEIQLRMRRHEISNLGIKNHSDSFSEQYKRAFFVDWRACDKLKKILFSKIDYFLDTNDRDHPKMVSGNTLRDAFDATVTGPFRLVPFFDPGPWGGQWMKEVCDLDRNTPNFAWCFDCVPEENSLLYNFSGITFETPSINLVFYKAKALLGEPVESRFGQEFPIRFDFLDTMGGGNLSLQVHPTTQYIRDHFGMQYTQDESYYLLDAKEDAIVYLGLKKNIDPDSMIDDLNRAQDENAHFDTEKYVNLFPAKKHDHFLIPNGTIHCSGKNCMVLEISATPYIFTFKLWDWARLGLDGKPRPINIHRGKDVIDWKRDEDYCTRQLINRIEPIAQGNGWKEERTGLHQNEFIETRRHWFTGKVDHSTYDSVNVLNLVEGDEAVIESPTGSFEPFIVHYAETFVIPAKVGNYTIRPYGKSEGKTCATIKAFVRFKA